MNRNKGYWSNNVFWSLTICLAICMLLYCYIAWNSATAWGDIGAITRNSAWIKRHLQPSHIDTMVLAINIAYDKQLVPHYDEYGIQDGTIDITDREKLYQLFRFLNDNPNYRYIVCDVGFSRDYHTLYDSLLYDLLAKMERICISSIGEPIEMLDLISCSAEYQMKRAGDGFLQYKYTSSDRQSIPVRMWEDIDNGRYCKHWYGYTRNGRLCSDGVIPDMHFAIEDNYDASGRKQLYNLGTDILNHACTEEGKLFKDKIILIGDWTENDMHDTMRAEQPGISILYNAYLILRDGKNSIPWYMLLILLLLFWAVSIIALWRKNAYLSQCQYIQKMQQYINQHKILMVCFRFISIIFVLECVFVVCYFAFDRYINILAIGVILTIISFII